MTQQQKRKRKPKRPYGILFVSMLFVALMAGMLWFNASFAINNKMQLINNSYNSRQQILLAQNTRGEIRAKDGTVLAQTVTDENGKEVRNYPYSNMFAHIVGFSTQGKMGVESLANYYLINTSASISEKAKEDAAGAKYPGDNVITTLDANLQSICYLSLSGYSGSVVVTDPKTGAILAMVSEPDFDPNTIDADWDSLVSDEDNSQLLNRATQGLYPPGSTFKIITSLEYIRENPESYSSYSYNCNGSYTYGEDTIRCYHGQKHGTVDFATSFAKSCNSSFANIGMSLNRDSFQATLQDLMFGQELPLDLLYSKSSATCNENTADADIMQLAIGQGTTAMTPMHLNMITSAIANDGLLMKPYILDHVESASGKLVKSFSSESYKQLMTAEEAGELNQLMQGVVENGTGKRLKGQNYTAAGKTGSAEYSGLTTDSHAWFTGFAPADDPQICVTIILEKAGSGGEKAVPVAKRIFDGYFGETGQFQEEEDTDWEDEFIYGDD